MLKTYTINLGRFGKFEATNFGELVLKITETENPYVYKMNLLVTEDGETVTTKYTYVPEDHSAENKTVTFGQGLV